MSGAGIEPQIFVVEADRFPRSVKTLRNHRGILWFLLFHQDLETESAKVTGFSRRSRCRRRWRRPRCGRWGVAASACRSSSLRASTPSRRCGPSRRRRCRDCRTCRAPKKKTSAIVVVVVVVVVAFRSDFYCFTLSKSGTFLQQQSIKDRKEKNMTRKAT